MGAMSAIASAAIPLQATVLLALQSNTNELSDGRALCVLPHRPDRPTAAVLLSNVCGISSERGKRPVRQIPIPIRRNHMSTSKKPGKEEKKHSLLTPKEKKTAKKMKKHATDSVPLLERS